MPKKSVSIGPFLIALLAAPLLVSALTIWIKFLPLRVLPVALPGHLLLGGPLYFWMLKTGRDEGVSLGLASCLVGALSLGLVLFILPQFDARIAGLAMIVTMLILPFLLLWALTFTTLYRAMTGSRFARQTARRLIIAGAISLALTGVYVAAA